VDFRDVTRSPADLAEMLARAGGERQVPVIVENGRVTIGYGGT
jgi:glutaredoxin 3